jgi:isohexenylglutaconyl-CoA hydratase
VKRLVLGCATEDDRAVLDDAVESLMGLLRRPQAREGVAAFKVRRAPMGEEG